jgi:hypothetical protein
MKVTVGTSYFVDRVKAVKYYRNQCHDNRMALAVVANRLRAGDIHIGKPDIKPGQELIIIDDGTRYAIVEVDRKKP